MVSLSRLAARMNLRRAGDGDPEISGITEDSRAVQPGWLFVAVPGLKYDGRDFIDEAVKRGAAAVMLPSPDLDLPVPRLLVDSRELRPAMAGTAAVVHGRPSDRLILVGLTGTNGKTTTAYLLEAVLQKAGLAPGVMGTVNFRWPGVERPAPNTTPEGPVLSGCLAEMIDSGAKAAVLEVSSHALALGRVAGLGFESALFTNLSRDHMDFHADMEEYFQAKKLLFTKHLKPGQKRAVVNIDDEYGRRLAAELDSPVTFGFSPEAEVRGLGLRLSRDGLSLTITAPGVTWEQTSPLIAEINGYNILAAAAMALALRLEPATIREALASAIGAPGRLERVGGNNDFLALVDYAHTPDALAKALKACRDLEPRRLLTVFGCGGDRDKGKRPLMGKIAGEMADLSIITSDNPRTEEPWSILLEVEAGLGELALSKYEDGELASDDWRRGCLLMVDRRAAIREAVRLMEPGDILLIAGKGHEDYQIIGREKRHLDDREEALASLESMGRA
ncbi:MAG: UDP-N-acetylmuramoyl-L-alanyl-D-glutamate--2,6-diaminopimelate ligase [Candidatus Adiutrix sp.]|jgi:UDP-N-acetylmuramoyl-L-alanyl-D-glutamate--2,6-diaminopimelate ligase|nr:UDP-N-acetylmuramoyl-L-alanyl-D-glutamate--2,6-diaminopimelate ligase [Candidatus Adiutrix sp.]